MLYKFQDYINEAAYIDYSSDEVNIISEYFLSLDTKPVEKVVVESIEDIGGIFDTEVEYKISEYLGTDKITNGRPSGQQYHQLCYKTDISNDLFLFNNTRDIKRCFSSFLNGDSLCYMFAVNLSFLLDEDHNKKRYERYINNIILQKLKGYIVDTVIKAGKGDKFCKVEIAIVNPNFEFINPLNNSYCLKYIKNDPKSIYSLGKYLNVKTLVALIDKNPSYLQMVDTQEKLTYIKHTKEKTNPDRRKMEKGSQMYAFALKPIFDEDKDGRYTRDVDIERMVPIDPYNANDGFTLKMMKLRATTQGDTQVYCIWLPKDAYTQDELDKINDKDYTYLRKAIDNKKERI